jgi:hypothetical protein
LRGRRITPQQVGHQIGDEAALDHKAWMTFGENGIVVVV